MSGPDASKPSLAEILVQDSLDGLAVLDREGRCTVWNHAMERFAGKPASEVLGRKMLEVFPFLLELGLDEALAPPLAGETVTTDGVEQFAPDGSRRVYDGVYLPLRSAGAEVNGVIAIVRDATARYAAIDALRQSEASLRMAVEAAEIGG